MTAFGIVAGMILTWLWLSPASAGEWMADAVEAYRARFEDEDGQ